MSYRTNQQSTPEGAKVNVRMLWLRELNMKISSMFYNEHKTASPKANLIHCLEIIWQCLFTASHAVQATPALRVTNCYKHCRTKLSSLRSLRMTQSKDGGSTSILLPLFITLGQLCLWSGTRLRAFGGQQGVIYQKESESRRIAHFDLYDTRSYGIRHKTVFCVYFCQIICIKKGTAGPAVP